MRTVSRETVAKRKAERSAKRKATIHANKVKKVRAKNAARKRELRAGAPRLKPAKKVTKPAKQTPVVTTAREDHFDKMRGIARTLVLMEYHDRKAVLAYLNSQFGAE